MKNEYEAVSINYNENDLNDLNNKGSKLSIKNYFLNFIKNIFNDFIQYKKILKRNKIQIYNFFIVILLFITIYFYHKSLFGCYKKDQKD